MVRAKVITARSKWNLDTEKEIDYFDILYNFLETHQNIYRHLFDNKTFYEKLYSRSFSEEEINEALICIEQKM